MSDTTQRSIETRPAHTASAARPAGSRFSIVAATLIGIVAVLPYLNALPADFTFDDILIIRDNAAVQIYPWPRLLGYVDPTGSLYRPLTMLTYAANASLERDACGYHLVNVALHALVAVAVFFLALRILDSHFGATVAALLFATHPIHTEAVTGIVGRAELLAALGILLALLSWARAHDATGRQRVRWWCGSLAAFAAALLAKESALTGVALIAVFQWWVDRSTTARRRVRQLLPYVCVGVAYLVLRFAVVGALGLPHRPEALNNPLAHVDVWSRLRTATIVLWEYVGLLALPIHLSADYSFNQIPVAYAWLEPRFVIAATALGALTIVLLALRRRVPALLLAALCVLIPLGLTANVLVPIGTIKAERLLYLPSVGWVLACGWLASRAALQRSTAWVVSLSVIAAGCGARTWVRNLDWHDNQTLFLATLRDAPASAKAHYNAAVALKDAGRLEDAAVEYRRAIEIDPESVDAIYGICEIYEKRHIEAGAVYWCEDALRREPKLVTADIELGGIRARHGELDTAQAAFRAGLQIEPTNPVLLANLAIVLLAEGDRWEAQTLFQQLQRVDTLDPHEHELVAQARREIEVALR